MPVLEVITDQAPSRAQKQAFARAAQQIFSSVLGTPIGRMQLWFTDVSSKDSGEQLLNEPALNEPA